QVQLVRGHHLSIGVLELPPELVSDHLDIHRGGRRRGLGAEDYWQGKEQDQADDQDWTRGPQDLDDRAAVDLWRQAIAGAAAVADRRYNQHDFHHAADDDPQPDRQDEQIHALVGVV